MSHPTEKRYPARDERDELCDALWDLYYRVWSHTGDPRQEGNCMLEIYDGMCRKSGRDCSYSLKSQNLFFREDYQAVKGFFLTALKAFRKIEGDGFGR